MNIRTEPVILGAGIAGLAAGKILSNGPYSLKIIEQQDEPGGLLQTDRVGNFYFDRAGHFLHTQTKSFQKALNATGVQLDTFQRKSAVLIGNRIVPYPLQFNLWACDPDVVEAVRADLRNLQETSHKNTGLLDSLQNTWGRTLTLIFFRPYLEKMWGCSLQQIPSSWGARFVPEQNLDLIHKGFKEPTKIYGYNSSFIYPASGRIGDLAKAFASELNTSIKLNAKVVAIESGKKMIRLSTGETFRYSQLISTIPLNRLLKMLGREGAEDYLSYSNLLNVRVGFRGKILRQEHWYYLPEKTTPFFRVNFPGNVSNHVCPPECASLSLEYGLGKKNTLDCSLHEMIRQTLDYLAKKRILCWDSINVVDSHLISPAYVSHRMPVTPVLRRLAKGLESEGIFLAGRYGAWDYFSLEEAWQSGADAAQKILHKL